MIAVTGAASAQQVTGTLGSPSATSTVSNRQLPARDPKFGGVIKNDALQSKSWWAPRVVPPTGAPNVLLIITDDVDENLYLASRNLKHVLIVEPRYADPLSLIHYKKVIVTKPAISKLEEMWG